MGVYRFLYVTQYILLPPRLRMIRLNRLNEVDRKHRLSSSEKRKCPSACLCQTVLLMAFSLKKYCSKIFLTMSVILPICLIHLIELSKTLFSK